MDTLRDKIHYSVLGFKKSLSHELQILFGAFVVLVLFVILTSLLNLISGQDINWFGRKKITAPVSRHVYNTGHSPGYEKVARIEAEGKVPQFVIFSFDGSKSLNMWKETQDFAKSMREQGSPLSFTYFINAVYFLQGDERYSYQAPGHGKGVSNIGFGESVEDIKSRVKMINSALREGHEISSHTAGHFDGSYWSKDDWTSEFNSFNNILSKTDERLAFADHSTNVLTQAAAAIGAAIGLPKKPDDYEPLLLDVNTIKGFRAPLLGISNGMYETLKDSLYKYDASKIYRSATWPIKDSEGIWQFPLNTIYLGGDNLRGVLGMDYSVYVAQTGAQDLFVRGTPEWQAAYNDVLQAWRGYFEHSYNDSNGKIGAGDHAPISIADHFSKWNDGVYWEAYKAIAREVCGKSDVYCGTYRDLYMYLDSKPEKTKQALSDNDKANAIDTLRSVSDSKYAANIEASNVYVGEFHNDDVVHEE